MSAARSGRLAALAILTLAQAAGGQDAASCESRWTFPIPFYQSVAWSPDGSRLAFAAVTESWDRGYSIFTVRADGSELQRLGAGGTRDLYPAWSPDGTRLAFASTRDGNRDVYTARPDGSELARLTEHPAHDGYPSWSPDGAHIAFHSDRDGNYEIYVMDADGSNPVRLTDHAADDYSPAWSPDGNWIAFESDRDGADGDEIYVIAADGSGVRQVVARGVFPTWSPRGDQLLYAERGLFAVGLDGTGNRQIVEQAVFGAWAPDGRTVAVAARRYDSECKDHYSLVVLDPADGSRRPLLP